MQVLPIKTPILNEGDDIASALLRGTVIEQGDVIVVSAKVMATIEGAYMDLSGMRPTKEAVTWAEKSGRSPEFCQAVIGETKRLNGQIDGASPYALLTTLRPDGMTGVLRVPNAGLDESNIKTGFAIGWPHDPVASAQQLCAAITDQTGKRVAVVIGDSCCHMSRAGVTAIALVVCGIDPLYSEIGHKDLLGRKLHVTLEAVADQMATAANMVMGNAAQSTPAAIIRDHGRALSDFCGWVDGIEPEEDLFSPLLK